jgi:hypothetical protein
MCSALPGSELDEWKCTLPLVDSNVYIERRGEFAAGRIWYFDDFGPTPEEGEIHDPTELHQLVDEYNKVGPCTKHTYVSAKLIEGSRTAE